ncbi:MAG: amidohydrolase family protein [Planctomycetota bacterium]|jgi:predicted TIM-barrel fold metal-dependent hydrolase
MRLFDFALLVGSDPRSQAEGSREDLIEYLDREDAAGLVASLAGAYYDFAAGNRETLEISDRDKRLFPAFTLDPRRAEAVSVDIASAVSEGFRALVLFPAIQSWDFSHPALAGIIGRAAEAGLPIVLHLNRNASVAGVAAFAREVDVPVVACGLSYGSLGAVLSLAGTAENLLFGVRLFAGLDNLETLASRLGAERLVFDSGEPLASNAAPLETLKTAVMSDEARELILTGNARRVLGSDEE